MVKQRLRSMFGVGIRLALLASLLVIVIFGLPRLYTAFHYQPYVYQNADAPAAPIAIVFGAGLQRDGTPTLVLRDRMQTAAELYQAGKVQKILLSGDNRFVNYNEPQAMFDYGL